jgi:hypothetical protein
MRFGGFGPTRLPNHSKRVMLTHLVVAEDHGH